MSRLPARLALLLACLAAAGYAAFLTWSSERQSRQLGSSARAFEAAARSARAGIVELRAAQQAYVAVGQGHDFWFARGSSVREQLREALAAMQALARPSAAMALDGAKGSLDDFDRMDMRARQLAESRQLAAASDLIFSDGLELTNQASEAVERAVAAELRAHDEALASLGRTQEYALAGAASAVALTLLLLLVPVGREPASAPALARPAVPAPAATSGSALDLAGLDDGGIVSHARRVPPGERLPDAEREPKQETPKFPAPKPLVARVTPKPPLVSLTSVASLCGDLARVSDTQALPRLLERTAGVLDATGIIVWIADPDGRELSPILVHGYPPQLAARLGNIARDAENVTASAYRSALLQTLKGDTISNGAIAAPLVSAAGCVGVMAAEMKNGGEQQEPLLAAATIIASQLATLVGPPPARARAEAAG
jgi:hypothetical protein